jgi:hypothetical protein
VDTPGPPDLDLRDPRAGAEVSEPHICPPPSRKMAYRERGNPDTREPTGPRQTHRVGGLRSHRRFGGQAGRLTGTSTLSYAWLRSLRQPRRRCSESPSSAGLLLAHYFDGAPARHNHHSLLSRLTLFSLRPLELWSETPFSSTVGTTCSTSRLLAASDREQMRTGTSPRLDHTDQKAHPPNKPRSQVSQHVLIWDKQCFAPCLSSFVPVASAQRTPRFEREEVK